MVFDYDLVTFIKEKHIPPPPEQGNETDHNKWLSIYHKLNFWNARSIKKRQKMLAARRQCLLKWQYEAEKEAGGYYLDGVFGNWNLTYELAVGPRCGPRYSRGFQPLSLK